MFSYNFCKQHEKKLADISVMYHLMKNHQWFT